MIMRSFFLTITLLAATIVAAQRSNALYIHSLKGQVSYRSQRAQTWQQPTIRQTVYRLDSMEVTANSQVVLIDGANDNVYTCATPMKDNVLRLIQAARGKANGLLESVAKQLRDNAMGRGVDSRQVVVAGVTTRAEEVDDLHDSIACLALEAGKRFAAGQTVYDSALEWRTVEENGLLHFVVTNTGSVAYCVNILAVAKETGHVSLRIIPSPDVAPEAMVVPAGETLDLSMYQFLPNTSLNYTLFTTRTAYTPSVVHAKLRHPEDLNCR